METPTIKKENTAVEKYLVMVPEPVVNSTNSSLETAQVTASQELTCGPTESCIEQEVKIIVSDTSNTSAIVSNGSLNLTSHALSFVPSLDENSNTHCTTSREIKEEAIEAAVLDNEIPAHEESQSPPAYFDTFVLHWGLADLQDPGQFVPNVSLFSELSVFLRALCHKRQKNEDARTFCERILKEHVASKESSNSGRLLLEKLFPQEEPETSEIDEIEKVLDNLSNDEIASVTQETDLKLVIKKIQEQPASKTTQIDSEDAASYTDLKVDKPDTNGKRASVTPESELHSIVQKISIHELQNMIKNACSSSSENVNLPNCEESSLPNDSFIMQSKSPLENLASSLSEASCANKINPIPSRPSNELDSILDTINDSSNDSCEDTAKFSSDDGNATMKNLSLEEGELRPELSPKKKRRKTRDKKSSKRSYSEMSLKRKEHESTSSNSAHFRKTKSHEKRNYRRRKDEPERKKPKTDTYEKKDRKLAYNPSKRQNEKSRTSVFHEMRAAVQSLSPTPFTSSSQFCHSRSSHYDVASSSSSNNNSPHRSDDDPYEINIPPSRLFESVGKTFMCSSKALKVILSWVPMWLIEVDEPEQKELPPLFGNAHITLKPTKYYYSNFLEYFNIVFPLMLLDLFSRLHAAYKNCIKDKKCRPYKFDFVNAKEVDNVIDIEAEMLFPPINFPTIEGQLAIITLGLNCGKKRDVFGYIQNQHVTTELSSQSEVLHVHIQIKISMQNINKDMQISVMPFYPLEKVLNMIDALNSLKTSPLQDIILGPCQPHCTKITLERIGGIAESVHIVNRTVEKIKGGISLNEWRIPRILVVDSPPGTDLMSTIIAFIVDVKKFEVPHKKHRILVCTRTLKQLSNIGLRLLPLGEEDTTCSPINITILLKASGISDPELKKHTLEYQMLEQIRFMKRKNETSQKQWSEDEARKYVINDTDVVLSQIPQSYDSSIQPLFEKDLHFSFCILDESYTFTEPEASLPLLYGIRKLVLVGDSQQQPRAPSNISANYNYYQPLPLRLTKKRFSVHF